LRLVVDDALVPHLPREQHVGRDDLALLVLVHRERLQPAARGPALRPVGEEFFVVYLAEAVRARRLDVDARPLVRAEIDERVRLGDRAAHRERKRPRDRDVEHRRAHAVVMTLLEDLRDARLIEVVGAELRIALVRRAREERRVHRAVQQVAALLVVARARDRALLIGDERIEAARVPRVRSFVPRVGRREDPEREERVRVPLPSALGTGEHLGLRGRDRPPRVELIVSVTGTELRGVFVAVRFLRRSPLVRSTREEQYGERPAHVRQRNIGR